MEPQVFKFSAPKPVVGDSVIRSQFVTGWLPESRSHFATLNSGEDLVPDGAGRRVVADFGLRGQSCTAGATPLWGGRGSFRVRHAVRKRRRRCALPAHSKTLARRSGRHSSTRSRLSAPISFCFQSPAALAAGNLLNFRFKCLLQSLHFIFIRHRLCFSSLQFVVCIFDQLLECFMQSTYFFN